MVEAVSTVNPPRNTEHKIRLLIADDHPSFRRGLSQLLVQESDIEIVSVVGDGEEAVSVVKDTLPDVVVIDAVMPKMNGIAATKEIKAASPNTAVVVLSAYDYESYVLGAIEAGASAYLLKTEDVDQIIGAIRAVCRGETVLGPAAAKAVFDRLAYATGKATSDSPNKRLYKREQEVLKLAAQGLSNREIGVELAISERTVQTHFITAFRKLGVDSRIEAVLQALKDGWITLDSVP